MDFGEYTQDPDADGLLASPLEEPLASLGVVAEDRCVASGCAQTMVPKNPKRPPSHAAGKRVMPSRNAEKRDVTMSATTTATTTRTRTTAAADLMSIEVPEAKMLWIDPNAGVRWVVDGIGCIGLFS